MSTSKGALSHDEEILLARVGDLVARCEQRGAAVFTKFLNEREQVLARMVPSRGVGFCFYAGHPGGERSMLGVFPEGQSADLALFPIQPVQFTYRRQDALSHRDFLGALMNLRLEREAVGDILVDEGRAVAFLLPTAAQVVLSELTQIGRAGVKVSAGLPSELPSARSYEDISGTVSSLRLDCVVSLLLRLSREKSSALIKSELVAVNLLPISAPAHMLCEGDKLSIRGQGRFLLEKIGGQTKKGRLHLTCKKYI